ncbi:MAG: hypothetical protein AB8I08_28430 [Sandaracinaceae bacterium]
MKKSMTLLRLEWIRLGLISAGLAWGAFAMPACSSIGDPGGTPDGLPHGGTGKFRLLDSAETGVSGSLPGRAIVLLNRTIEGVSVTENSIFYAQSTVLDDPPPLPDDHPPTEIFRGAFGNRSIFRGTLRTEGIGAYDAGNEVLAATEDWEGDELIDPSVAVDPDGTVRLYYAAAGGIGVAEASAEDGTFSKVSGPILDMSAGSGVAPRRPSVVRNIDDTGWIMFFDRGDGLGIATSDDGVAFSDARALPLEGEDEGMSPEVRIAHPGAVRIATSADRALIRVYFESIREDGTHQIYLAGTDDGETFERWPRSVIDNNDVRLPTVRQLDSRVTFLYLNLPFIGGSFQTRGISVASSPAGQRFDPPEPEGF